MVDIQISGSMPVLNTDFSQALQRTEEIMLASVQLNIMMGGRPPFNVKNKNNSTPLVGSGKMYHGIKSTRDTSSATVYMDPSVVSKKGFFYPRALNDGATIPPVDGKLMVFTIDGHTVFTYKRKGFKLGAFPFMIFQEQDKVRILEEFANSIFSKSQVTFS
jgi:phage gpG-like protein